MKKLGLILVLTTMLIMLGISADAALSPTGPTTENATNFFETWSADSRVERLLKDNYAFVDSENTAWILSEKKNMGEKAYIHNGEMYIPDSFAGEVFGYTSSQEEVKLSDIASDKGLYLFFDPIGFALLSENEGAVNTADNGVRGYTDYYTVSDAM